MNMLKKYSTTELILAGIVLVGVVGLAFGIRHIMSLRASLDEPMAPVVKASAGGDFAVEEVVAAVEPVVEVVAEAEPVVVEVEEVVEEVDEAPVSMAAEPEPEPEPQRPRTNDAEIWKRVFGEMKLTPEEEERVKAGFGLAIQRFWQMSETERESEMARMRGMRERWDAMDEEGREVALIRIRDRFEDWRMSGSVELPELSLD